MERRGEEKGKEQRKGTGGEVSKGEKRKWKENRKKKGDIKELRKEDREKKNSGFGKIVM